MGSHFDAIGFRDNGSTQSGADYFINMAVLSGTKTPLTQGAYSELHATGGSALSVWIDRETSDIGGIGLYFYGEYVQRLRVRLLHADEELPGEGICFCALPPGGAAGADLVPVDFALYKFLEHAEGLSMMIDEIEEEEQSAGVPVTNPSIRKTVPFNIIGLGRVGRAFSTVEEFRNLPENEGFPDVYYAPIGHDQGSREDIAAYANVNLRGRILAMNEIENSYSGFMVVVLLLDLGIMQMEVCLSPEDLHGGVLAPGHYLQGNFWLTGRPVDE